MTAQVSPIENSPSPCCGPPTTTALLFNMQHLCRERAFQNGCSLEDDGRVCLNLGLGHLVLEGSAQMLAFTMSLRPRLQCPGSSVLWGSVFYTPTYQWDRFISISHWNNTHARGLFCLGWPCLRSEIDWVTKFCCSIVQYRNLSSCYLIFCWGIHCEYCWQVPFSVFKRHFTQNCDIL